MQDARTKVAECNNQKSLRRHARRLERISRLMETALKTMRAPPIQGSCYRMIDKRCRTNHDILTVAHTFDDNVPKRPVQATNTLTEMEFYQHFQLTENLRMQISQLTNFVVFIIRQFVERIEGLGIQITDEFFQDLFRAMRQYRQDL